MKDEEARRALDRVDSRINRSTLIYSPTTGRPVEVIDAIRAILDYLDLELVTPGQVTVRRKKKDKDG